MSSGITVNSARSPGRERVDPPIPDPAALGRIRRTLLTWYDENRRELPWRAGPGERPDPYAVWVSEVMLQQTRVETVRPYYERWLADFPTVQALAAAPESAVLKAWEGLGYYSRARNLHRAVREVATRYGGEIPAEPAVFRSLPGVGRYTAGAVASIAFGREEPIVDGNVRRVFARLLDRAEPTDAELWDLAGRIVGGKRPGDLNQALMELGALVCTPRSPGCGTCPVRAECAARAAGTVDDRPARKVARAVPVEHHGVAVVVRGERVLLVQRPDGGRLAGLWEFPGACREAGEEALEAAARAYTEGIRGAGSADASAGTGASAAQDGDGITANTVSATEFSPLCSVTHAFTHVRVVYEAFIRRESTPDSRTDREAGAKAAWVGIPSIGDYALPRAQQKIAEALRAALLIRSPEVGGPGG